MNLSSTAGENTTLIPVNERGLFSRKSTIYKIMRIGVVAVALFITTSVQLLCAAPTKSQTIDEYTVSLGFQNETLMHAFKKIEENSPFRFMYRYDEIKNITGINIPAKKQTVEAVLEAILSNTDLNFRQVNNQALIMHSGQNKQSFPDYTVNLKYAAMSGRVVNSVGDALSGVSVTIKNGTGGTSTDEDGYFSINVTSADTLVFSYVGYQSREVAVGNQTQLSVTLETSDSSLERVIVIGYGTTRKKDLTGSVVQIKSEELQKVPVYNMEEALKGRAAGVQVTNNSGAPGSRIEVRIRGSNSMIGDNTPLYVVDGFPVTGGIDFLNPADIESINILKDASATAIYGSRGANGVVIITSKRGKGKSRSSVSIDAYYGTQKVAKTYDVLDAKQYATVANEFLKNDGLDPYFDVDTIQNPGTNWQDLIFREAPQQNHTLTIAGSNDKTNYSFSANYYDQTGIILNSSAKRGSFRLNLDHEVKSWLKLSANIALSRRETYAAPVDNGERGSTMFSGALSAPPTLQPYNADGTLKRIETIYSFSDPTDMRNPLIWDKPRKDKTLTNSVLVNNALNFKLTKSLSFLTRFGVEYENTLADFFSPIIFSGDRGSASANTFYWNSFLNENTLNYSKTFNSKHRLDAVAGFTYQKYISRYNTISVSGFANNITENYNLGSAETINPPGSGFSDWALASWLGRVNYVFNNRYFITASARADGSSRFGEDNKWGIFPSAAVGWDVSEEEFMQNVRFVNNLKLRASYGVTGNTGLSPYQSLNRLSPVNYIYGGSALNIGYVPSGLANSKLRWETTKGLDFGLDLSVFNSRVSFTFDYYKKNTDNLLASVPLPPSVGFGSVLQNVGEVQNQGVEFSLSGDILVKKFKWTASAQLSANRNKVIALAGGSDIIASGSLSGLSGVNIARIGAPLGVFYGYVEDGLNEDGYIQYVDINGDGEINPLDRTIIGTPYPKFTFGFNSTFSYKNFDMSFFIQGSQGNDIFWRTAYTNLNSFQRSQNQLEDIFGNYWTAEKPDANAKYPKISKSTQMLGSDRFIKDGSYLRLKSLQLGYSVPAKGKKWFTRARIYISATNLFTATNYPGLDPEINTTGNDSQDIGSRLQIGIDASGYPNARIFGTGIQFTF